MANSDEDRRAAATIATSLSGYVMAGALALIGAEAAIFTFLLDKKLIGSWFWSLLLFCFLSLFFSCYLGGKAIWKIYADGAKGVWRTTSDGLFAYQLLLALAGIVMLIFAAILASRAPERKEKSGPSPDNETICAPIMQSKPSTAQGRRPLSPSAH